MLNCFELLVHNEKIPVFLHFFFYFLIIDYTLCHHLVAHGCGGLLGRREELLVGLPERSPQQSLPKVLNIKRTTELASYALYGF